MKCQILLSGKNKKNIIDLSSAGFASSTRSVYITPDQEYRDKFFFYLSVSLQKHVVGIHMKCLREAIQMSTNKMLFSLRNKKISICLG